MKICHFSDTHLSPLGHTPQSRTASYHDDVAAEMKLLGESLTAENPDIIICSGDIFHLKNQSAYSPKDINYYSSLLREFPSFYSIPGNHDLPKSAYINVKDSPYTSLCNAIPNVITDLSGLQVTIPLQGDFKNFRLVGVPYVPMSALKSTLETFLPTILEPADSPLSPMMYGFIIHVDATPDKILVNLWDSFSFQELADMFPKNSVLFMGHIHASFPPWQDPVRNVTISKPWSIGRVIKDYFNQTDILEKQHVPSYSVFTIDSTAEGTAMNMYYKPLPVRGGFDIFEAESLQIQLEKSKEIQNFIQGLKTQMSGNDVFFTQNPMSYLQGLNLQKEIFDVITEYLNRG